MRNLIRSVSVFSLVAAALSAHAQSFTDGFEGATFPTTPAGGTVTSAVNWTVVNNSSTVGTTSYFAGNPTVFTAHTGTGYAGANFNNTTGAGTIDDYLMTPTLALKNGDTFSFWTRTTTATFPDRLLVKLSKAGASTAVADFSTTLLTINPNLAAGAANYPTAWTQYSVTLSGLATATSGRLAFDYNVTSGGPSGANSDYIGIDDVVYTAVPEPSAFAALGLGAVALLKRRKRA